jgi:hypothetical protein
MNFEIGAEAALFPEKEYIKEIFVAVYIRVPEFLSSRPNWLPPPLHPPRVLPPLGSKGGDTLAGGRGAGRSQFGRRDRHSGTLGKGISLYTD